MRYGSRTVADHYRDLGIQLKQEEEQGPQQAQGRKQQ